MAFENGHALLVGVGRYTYIPSANIPISVADARAVRDVVRDAAICGYPAEQVTLLHDDGAKREDILGALDTLAANAATETTVLFYYCGHGEYGTDDNYYLTTNDTKASRGRVVQGTGIQEAELMDKLRSIPARRILLLFNACHSGEISPSLGFADQDRSFGDITPPPNAVDALLSSGEGRIIITASRPEQKSWIGNGELSIYTQALVDGLSGNGYATDNNGYVSAFSLYESMYQSIQEAADALGRTQEPELTVLRGVGPFPVSLYPGASSYGTFKAEDKLPPRTAARDVDPARSQRLFQQYISMVEASGDSAVAIGGNVTRSTIITGGQRTINTGGGAYVEGMVDTGGGDFVGHDQYKTTGFDAEQVAMLFERIYTAIEAKDLSEMDKQDLKADVEDVKNEAEKGDQVDERFLTRRLRNIQRMAPDILEVVLATLTNPAAGFALTVQKIASKVQAEAGL